MILPLIVPVLSRFDLFTHLMKSVDVEIKPYVIDCYVHNRGVSGAWNEGMRAVLSDGYTHAMISNDDVVFQPGSLKKLQETLFDTDACMVSGYTDLGAEPHGLVETVDFCNFVVDIPQLINNCGAFDEKFIRAYFEDNDMHYRMRLAGLKGYINTDAKVLHHGSATQFANPSSPVVPSSDFEINRSYFTSKWGGQPGQEIYTRPFNDPAKEIWDW